MNDSVPSTPSYPPVMPMTFGQILDRIFRLLRTSWRPFVGIGLFPIGLFLLLYAVIFGAMFAGGFFKQPPVNPNLNGLLIAIFPLYAVMLVVMFVAYGIYYGASTYAALHADQGRTVTAAESFRHAWSKMGRYSWLYLLRALIVAAPILVCAVAVGIGALIVSLTATGSPNPGLLFLLIPLGVLAYLGGIVWAVLMSLRYALAFPVCVQENLTAMQALKRSGVLTEGAKGRIFLVALIIYAIGYIGIMIVYAIGAFSVAIAIFAGAGHWQQMGFVGYIGVGVLALVVVAFVLLYAVLLMAAYSIAFAVFYRDQRLRMEGPPTAAISSVEG